MPEDTELTNIQNAMATLLAKAAGGKLASGYGCSNVDLSTVVAIDKDTSCTIYLTDFLTGLTEDKVKSSGYMFTEDGKAVLA